MDIPNAPGCVQANLMKAGQIGGSEALRCLLAYWAARDPDPVGLTLPSRDKGRQIVKHDVLPLFRRTAALRRLLGHPAREALIESISLLNGFQLDLMWSGSATSMASNPYRRVVNDEVDKFEPWSGEEADAIAATEVRLTTYGDRRCQVNLSTPTTQAGKIYRLWLAATVKLFFHVPCPHCGHRQRLRWPQLKWAGLDTVEKWLAAARKAVKAGRTWYRTDKWTTRLPTPAALADHVAWLTDVRGRLTAAEGRADLADVLTSERERLIWYECEACGGRIADEQKVAMIRRGRWTTAEGFVTGADGRRHADAADVKAWPPETRIGLQISALYCLWIHWGQLVGEWLRSQDDREALFFFTTNRLGEAFEFRLKRSKPDLYAAKSRRAKLKAEVAPDWAWVLLATIDTQADGFYAVVRAWGGAMMSQRIWHGRLRTFDELDRLIGATAWPVAGNAFAPMKVALALIDSGGTTDRLLDVSRTHQVYKWAIPRQPLVRAIKGANRPGPGLFWPMKDPLGTPQRRRRAAARGLNARALQAWLVDTHRCNDLLADLIASGIKPAAGDDRPDGRPAEPERWLLNRRNDPEYNAHMANVQKTINPKTKEEIWTPARTGVRHDYRDCEAYQVAAAYMANVHLLPGSDQVMAWKRQAAEGPPAAAGAAEGPDWIGKRDGEWL